MEYYHDHPENRIGDEIQLTAIFRYFQSRNDLVFYKDVNPYLSAIDLFRDDLVVFASDNLHHLPTLDPFNIWFWTSLLRDRGIYTQIKEVYQPGKTDLDAVFVPLLGAEYNYTRGMDPEMVLKVFNLLLKEFDNIRMVVDAKKANLLGINHPNIVLSKDIHHTFDFIRRSKRYIGGDTGTSHYAGALGHQKMVLIYPNESFIANQVRWHRDIMSEMFELPFHRYEYSALPCCNPKHYQVLTMDNNRIDPVDVLRSLEHF